MMTKTRRLSAAFALGLIALAGSRAMAQAPGPEMFAKPPKTPLELWDAVDYLVRTGQADRAVPYLNAFVAADPPEAILLQIRERYGVGSILRLDDHPETKAAARPLLDKINAAVKQNATEPERMQRSIGLLSKSREEQAYGVDRLREAGPLAIPPLIRTLSDASLPPADRALIVANMGRLDASTVPPLVAALGATDATVGADAATALGLIGDLRAVPFLTYPATGKTPPALREAAALAIERITGRPFPLQRKVAERLLADEAWRYHRHQVRFATDPTEIWIWDGDVPAPRQVSRTVAESILGGRLAREALALAPSDRSAQAALLSLALEKAVDRFGVGGVATQDPSGAFAAALASGPAVLATVLNTAIQDRHGDLAAVSALALGRVANRDASAYDAALNPLVAALTSPDRRVQYAAADALVQLNPSRPFSGSSRVVPTLARFAANRAPVALVLDGNVNRGNAVASTLQGIGYETEVVSSGQEAFGRAAESADVEVIVLQPTSLAGPWSLNDTLANLRADSRTTGVPVLLHGPLKLRDQLFEPLTRYPRVEFVVMPTDPAQARDLMGRRFGEMGVRFLSPEERAAYSQGAANLLATIASRPNSPLAKDLSRAEPALTKALDVPASAVAAASVLGDVPGGDAQRSLARIALDSSRPAPLRFEAAKALARSVQRFGALLTAEQETRLVGVLDGEPDPAIRGALSGVLGALRPNSSGVGTRLQAYQPTIAQPPPDAPPKPVAPADGDSGAP